MKILHLTLGSRGGAAIAAKRITEAQEYCGLDSKIINLSTTSMLSRISSKFDFELTKQNSQAMTLSLARGVGYMKELSQIISDHDPTTIINLHWLPGMLTNDVISKLRRLNVFWTLHDMNPFTSVCHHAFSCESFLQNCESCPQVSAAFRPTVRFSHYHKQNIMEKLDSVKFVSPSLWMADLALQSSIIRKRRVEVIPNPIPTTIFKPITKRRNGDDAFRIGILGASSGKGFDQNRSILDKIKNDAAITVRVFGGRMDGNDKYTVENLPWSNSELVLAENLAECDLILYSSQADNLPNFVIEAQACGVTVIASDTGGIGEIIQNEVSGYLFKNQNEAARIIESLVACREKVNNVKINARFSAVTKYSYQRIGELYEQLYRQN
jgi:glycosyltransferase involved in cell wall biosynthesis